MEEELTDVLAEVSISLSSAVADSTSNMVSQIYIFWTWLTFRTTSRMAFRSRWRTSTFSVRCVTGQERVTDMAEHRSDPCCDGRPGSGAGWYQPACRYHQGVWYQATEQDNANRAIDPPRRDYRVNGTWRSCRPVDVQGPRGSGLAGQSDCDNSETNDRGASQKMELLFDVIGVRLV